MGKHNTKTHEAAKRSRARRSPEDIAGDLPKYMRRRNTRLRLRQKDYDEVLSKSPHSSRYTRPGSMKTRTN